MERTERPLLSDWKRIGEKRIVVEPSTGKIVYTKKKKGFFVGRVVHYKSTCFIAAHQKIFTFIEPGVIIYTLNLTSVSVGR